MKTLALILTDTQHQELTLLLKDKSFPWQVAKRLEVIRLLDKGCSTAMIAVQLGIRKELVRKYYAEYTQGGFSALIRMEKPGKETALTEEKFRALECYMKKLKKEKRKYSLKDLTMFLATEYGITMSEEWLSKRLAVRKEAIKDQPWK